MVKPHIVRSSPRLQEIGHNFFSLKIRWPFHDNGKRRFGKYFFEGWEYRLDTIDYQSIGSRPSRYNPILLSLSSRFKNRDELKTAERMIGKLVNDFTNEYALLRSANIAEPESIDEGTIDR